MQTLWEPVGRATLVDRGRRRRSSGTPTGPRADWSGDVVSLATDRDADASERGTVRSTQCMFDAALRTERRLGLDAWHVRA